MPTRPVNEAAMPATIFGVLFLGVDHAGPLDRRRLWLPSVRADLGDRWPAETFR